MPKTREQIEREVREFYGKLTESDYLYEPDDPEKGKQEWVRFEVTEEEIQLAINSYQEEKVENAKKYKKLLKDANAEVDHLCETYNINQEYSFGRMTNHMLDLSGTTEAETKNVTFLKSVSTREGFKKYVQEQIELAKGLDINVLVNSNAIDGWAIFTNPETSQVANAAFIGGDLLSAAKDLGLDVSQESQELLRYNAYLMAPLMSQIGRVQRVLTLPGAACVNSGIGAVSRIIQNPDCFSTRDTNEPFHLINDEIKSALDTRKFSEMNELDNLKVHRLIEQNHLPKRVDVIEDLSEGLVKGYKAGDGKEKMAAYRNGGLVIWDRTVQDTKLKSDDKYDAVRSEEARLFALIEGEGLKNEENSPAFKKLLKAAEDLDAEYKKGTAPDTKQKSDRLLNLVKALKDSAEAFLKASTVEMLNDPLTRKQLELAGAMLNFAKTESDCRKAHVEALPQTAFAKKLNTLLQKPEYDFKPQSKADSLRVRTFGLYKNSDSGQIMEQTDFVFTDYDSHPTMSSAEFDNKMKTDAYEFINSQYRISEGLMTANLNVYNAAKSCTAVVYPKNGDPNKMRMLYVDKNGDPRLSPPLDEMPNMGATMARLDRLRDEGKGFENFPENPVNDLSDRSPEAQKRITDALKQRQEMAMSEFIKDCGAFFPDAEKPELLVNNALNYSAARQNLVFSDYGEVYLTEEQKRNSTVVKAAEDMKIKAIGTELARRQLETNLILDNARHPEYYATRELAQERAGIHRAHAALSYETEPENEAANTALYSSHHAELTEAMESFLETKGMKLSGIRFYDAGAKEIGTEQGAKPWDRYEKAAALIENGEPVYFKAQNSEKLQKLGSIEDEFKLTEAGGPFRSEGDAAKRRTDFENIEALYNRMTATGTTRRDSEEYRGMVAATKAALEIARACNTNEATPQALIARERLDAAKAKMADAADKYFVAKVDGSMNSRRTSRFAVAMFARHIADRNYSEVALNPDNLMKEAVAAKLVRAEARKKINNHAPVADEANRVLTDRSVLKTKAAEMEKTDAFKALTSKPGEINKVFTNDPDKLLKKYNEKALAR